VTVPRFERRHQQVAAAGVFARRMTVFVAIALALTFAWVGIGTVVFRQTIEGASWVDAFRHASLLASGMGPAPDLRQSSDAGKIAEALYSLFSGFVLLASAGVVAAPIVHRVFHRFHVDDRER
jgi:hypothetical protein